VLPELAFGGVNICLGGPEVVRGADESFDITVEGVVEDTWASDFNLTGCEAAPTRGIEIIDDNGDTWHLGVALTDEDGQRLDTPNLAFTGRDVTLTYRYRKPWGDVSGYVLSDRDGLVAAADEGSWGGALRQDDVPGVSIRVGEEIIAQEETGCSTLVGYDLIFEADTAVTLSPVASATLKVDGRNHRAHALDAHEDLSGESCANQEMPGVFGWAITR